ncbi:MAG: hypothetical protein ACFFD2_23375 [Promethearchaeota archaeon]
MNVKGLAFKQIKNQISIEFGKDRWDNFFQMFRKLNPKFRSTILMTTPIPIESFMAFTESVIKEFYKGDEKIYWRMGLNAAKTSLNKTGPLNIYLQHKKKLEFFVANILPRIWNNYFDEGYEKFLLEGNILHAHILDLPKYYVYLEYIVMGYIQKALEILGVPVNKTVKVKATAKEIYYKFILDL